jgi:hypothetical protein
VARGGFLLVLALATAGLSLTHPRPAPERQTGVQPPARSRSPAPAVSALSPAPGNPFLALGGAWVWITHEGWRSTIWYAAPGDTVPKAIAVIESRDQFGNVCAYRVSPDGRWLLTYCTPYFSGRTRWSLFDRITGKQHALPAACARAGLEAPIWRNPREIIFSGTDGPDGNHLHAEAWRYRLGSHRLRRIGSVPGQVSYESTINYYLRYEPGLRACATRLLEFEGLPARYARERALSLRDDASEPPDPLSPTPLSVQAGGQRIAMLSCDLFTEIGSPARASGPAFQRDGTTYRVTVFERGSGRPLATLGFERGEYPSSVRWLNRNEVYFTLQRYHPEGGVGFSHFAHWDGSPHPSRYLWSICRWNFVTDRFSVIGSGAAALRLPTLSRQD